MNYPLAEVHGIVNVPNVILAVLVVLAIGRLAVFLNRR
jgi:hypothetical protein